MKTIIYLLLLLPLFCFSQKAGTYIRLTNSKGQVIKGESVARGFEGCILASAINSGGKNNTQLSFSMNVSGATADLKSALANGEILSGGLVSVMTINFSSGRLEPSYTIKMEKISVVSCSDVMGANNVMCTNVILQATRIGWTYFATGKTGTQIVTKKYGWNSETNSEWTTF